MDFKLESDNRYTFLFQLKLPCYVNGKEKKKQNSNKNAELPLLSQ